MWQFDPRAFGPTVAALLLKAPLNELGPGEPNLAARPALASVSREALVAPHHLADIEMASACCAALWLRFDFLDESHHISQSIDTPAGSYWHGVMHRREPDFANAKYWLRRAGKHPMYPRLAELARQLVVELKPSSQTAFLAYQQEWNPVAFTNLCETALDDIPPVHTLCRRIQQLEWELLFEHCYRNAIDE